MHNEIKSAGLHSQYNTIQYYFIEKAVRTQLNKNRTIRVVVAVISRIIIVITSLNFSADWRLWRFIN